MEIGYSYRIGRQCEIGVQRPLGQRTLLVKGKRRTLHPGVQRIYIESDPVQWTLVLTINERLTFRRHLELT